MSHWTQDRDPQHDKRLNNQSIGSSYSVNQVIDTTRPHRDTTGNTSLTSHSSALMNQVDDRYQPNLLINQTYEQLKQQSNQSISQPYCITATDWNHDSINALSQLSSPRFSKNQNSFVNTNLQQMFASEDIRDFSDLNQSMNRTMFPTSLSSTLSTVTNQSLATPPDHFSRSLPLGQSQQQQPSFQPSVIPSSTIQSLSSTSDRLPSVNQSDSLLHQIIRLPSWSTNPTGYMKHLLVSTSIKKLLMSLNTYCPTGEFDPPARELAFLTALFLKDSTFEMASSNQSNQSTHALQHVIPIVESRFNLLFQSGHLPHELISQLAKFLNQPNPPEMHSPQLMFNAVNTSINQTISQSISQPLNNQVSNLYPQPLNMDLSNSFPLSMTSTSLLSMTTPSSFSAAFPSLFGAQPLTAPQTSQPLTFQSVNQSTSQPVNQSIIDTPSLLNTASKSHSRASSLTLDHHLSVPSDSPASQPITNLSPSPLPLDALVLASPAARPNKGRSRRQSLSPNHHSVLRPPTIPRSRKRASVLDTPQSNSSDLTRTSSFTSHESGSGSGGHKVQRIEERWNCPNSGCSKYYRPTSSASIRAHCLSCKFRPIDQIVDARLTDRRRKAVNEKEEEARLELPPA